MEKARVLIIEDNPVDALCVKESLERARGENFAIAQAETLAEAKQYLKEEKFDALVLDLGLPDSQGLETLTQVQDSAPDIPVVVFSGTDDERLAIEAVRSGAQDYLLKDQCDESSLLRAIDFAMERCKLMTKNVGLEALSANREVLGKRIKQSRDAAPTEPSLLKKSRCIPGISDLTSQEVAQVIHELQVYQIELEMQNEELRKSEQDLTELSQKYKDLFDFTSVGYLMLDEKGVIREANLTGANLLGVPKRQLPGRPFVLFVLKELRDTFYLYWRKVLEAEAKEVYEVPLLRGEDNFPAHLEIVRAKDSQGEFTGLLRVIFWDLTFRAEQAKQRRKLDTFQALYDLALSMISDRELDKTLLMVVERARSLLETDTAYIALRDDPAQDVYMHILSGIRTEAFKKMRLPFGLGLGGKVATSGKGLIVTDYLKEIKSPVHDIVREEGLISGIVVPIQIGRTNLGVLYVFNRSETHFSKTDLDTLSLLGNLAAIEIIRKRQEIDLLNALENLEQKVQERTSELSKTNQQLSQEIIQREKAETILTSILSASPIGIGLTENRIMKWVNEAWLKMFGFEHEDECIGKNAAILYPSKEEYERVGKEIYTDLSIEAVTSTDAIFKRKDGSLFDGNIRVKGFHHPEMVQGAIAAISDISESKRAEKMLQEAGGRVRLALAGADLGWWEFNVQTEKTLADDRAVEILGYSPGEVKSIRRLWEESVHPDDRPVAVKAFARYLQGDTSSYETEHRVLAKSGEWKWILVRGKIVEHDAEGKPLRMAGTFLDIGNRKRAEEALRQSEHRFRAIFEGADDYIFLKDRELRFMQVNPAFERLAGVPASEIVGKRHEDVFGNETSDFIKTMELRVLAGETVEDEHSKVIRGMPMTFLAMRNPLRDSSGEVIGILTVLHDITDRKRREVSIGRTEVEYTSKSMRATLKWARTVAGGLTTILLTGESGSGKDHLAKFIHSHSDRANGPYFSINCAAIPRDLAESELFGHEKGAFTGAVGKKRGMLELAEGGTLLLNEIGDLSLHLQAKLLTFLDTKKFTRVGGEKEISVSARLIAATNRDLEKAVEEGSFRKDLIYRLNVVSIAIPPLRERLEDLPLLVQEILAKIRGEMQIHDIPVIGPAALEALKRYQWPGNVRELRNVLERALILSPGKEIRPSALGISESEAPLSSTEIKCFSASFPNTKSLNEMTRELKRFMVNEALRQSKGRKTKAADMLAISRDSLKHYIKTLSVEDKEGEDE